MEDESGCSSILFFRCGAVIEWSMSASCSYLMRSMRLISITTPLLGAVVCPSSDVRLP